MSKEKYSGYVPPFTVTPRAISLVAEISAQIERYAIRMEQADGLRLRKANLKSATTRLYDTEAKIICIVSKKGAQCIECHHKDI